MDQKDFIILFEKVWKKLQKKSKNLKKIKALKPPFKLIETPEIEIGYAWKSKSRSIPLSQSLDEISGDIICPYPPGIALVVPGERISKDRLNWIRTQGLYNQDLVNSYIRVLHT